MNKNRGYFCKIQSVPDNFRRKTKSCNFFLVFQRSLGSNEKNRMNILSHSDVTQTYCCQKLVGG